MPTDQPRQPGPPEPDPTPDPAGPRAVYRRYRPGDPDLTRGDLPGNCPAVAGNYSCTRTAGHLAPQHLAGIGRIVAATWTGDGADLEVWYGGPHDPLADREPAPEPASGPDPALLDRLSAGYGALLAALSRCPAADVTDLELLASVDLPSSTVDLLPGTLVRDDAERHGLVLEVRGRGGRATYLFAGPATSVAALLREVAEGRAATREPDPGPDRIDLVAAERAALLLGRAAQPRRLDPLVGDRLRALGLVLRTAGGWYRLTEAGAALRARLEVPGA